MNQLLEKSKQEVDTRLQIVSKTIRYERLKRKWTVEKLADITGLHPLTIQNIESGKTTDPNLYTIYTIAKAFGTTVGWLSVGTTVQTIFTKTPYDYYILGDRIANLRHSLGLSQRQFGEKIGKSKTQVSNYEHGYTDIKYITALKMTDNTPYDIDFLLNFLYC